MPLYMSTFGYKPEVWAGLVKSPENREKAVSQILEEAGCELRGLWYAFGEADGFALIEAPDNTTAAGLAIAITSSGAFRKFETTPVMTQGEMLDARASRVRPRLVPVQREPGSSRLPFAFPMGISRPPVSFSRR